MGRGVGGASAGSQSLVTALPDLRGQDLREAAVGLAGVTVLHSPCGSGRAGLEGLGGEQKQLGARARGRAASR